MSRRLELVVDTTPRTTVVFQLRDDHDPREYLRDIQTQIILGNFQAKLVEDITEERIIEP